MQVISAETRIPFAPPRKLTYKPTGLIPPVWPAQPIRPIVRFVLALPAEFQPSRQSEAGTLPGSRFSGRYNGAGRTAPAAHLRLRTDARMPT